MRSTRGARGLRGRRRDDADSESRADEERREPSHRHQRRPALALGHDHFFRRVHEVALDELHAELPQHRHGVRVFDALGDGLDLELDGLFDQLLDHGLRLEIAGEVLHQRAVDLDEIERHGGQQLVGIAAGAEALERDAEAHLLERAELRHRRVHVLLGDALGDLEAEARGLVRAGRRAAS